MPDVTQFNLYGQGIIQIKDKTARASIETLEQNIDELGNEQNTLANNQNTLNTRTSGVPNFQNTICFGDSYGQGWSPDGTYSSWEDQLEAILPGLQKSAKINGGGIGFAHVSASISQNALQCWNANKSDISWLSQATAVIVMLGLNDSDQQSSTVKSNATNFFEQVRSDCPNATIYYFYNTNYAIYSRAVCTACYEAAYSHSYVRCYESAWWMLLQDNYFSSDYKHPNANGYQLIARKMLNALTGVPVNNFVYYNISDVDGYTFNVFLTDETIRIYLSGTIPASRATAIGHFPTQFFDTDGNFAITTQDMVAILESGTTLNGQCAICYGGSTYRNSIYAIHIGDDLSVGTIRYSKTFNVYSFFGE